MKNTLVILALAVVAQSAQAIVVTTGDLGPQVVNGGDGGGWSVNLSTSDASNFAAATLSVKQGLWNSPGGEITVDVSLNGTVVGQFKTAGGYFSPGAVVSTFGNVQSLLSPTNPNVIGFQALNPTAGFDYAIGEVQIEYQAVPEPASLAAVMIGLGVLRRRRTK